MPGMLTSEHIMTVWNGELVQCLLCVSRPLGLLRNSLIGHSNRVYVGLFTETRDLAVDHGELLDSIYIPNQPRRLDLESLMPPSLNRSAFFR